MIHTLSLSYGKDSMACLEACKLLGYPIDRVIHAEVWATDTIPADIPPMVEFKEKADRIIKERYGLTVEHFAAERESQLLSYERQFYTKKRKGQLGRKNIYGFPMVKGAWCNSALKMRAINQARQAIEGKDVIQYIGIAADEPERIARHQGKDNIILPLVEIGWGEAYCRKWCEENDLLSPIYTKAARGGCWFCHNQGVEQLRLLRQDYPELWEKLLQWDWDSPYSFRPDGRTVHDYELRFYAEELGLVPTDRRFRWKDLEKLMLPD